MDIRDKVPVIRVAIRGANGRMGLQAIYASMENNEDILARAKTKELTDKDVWIDVIFGAFTADIPTVQQLLAGLMRSEKSKILEGYDKMGSPIFRLKADGKHELRTKYVEQTLDEEPQRDHIIPFDRQELIDSPEGLPAIKILSHDKQEVLSVIRHANVRLGELSAEAIMDRVLDTAKDLGANVLLSCVGDTAKKADRMQKWLDKIHDKKYAIGFLESAPAKGWEKRMLSRQDEISVLCSRNYSPTGTLFRTGIALKQPLFTYNSFEFGKAADRFKKIFTRITTQIIATDTFKDFAQILPKAPSTIREIDGQEILVNLPPSFLTLTSPNYLIFSFYEDNEYGFICGALIPNLKALGLVYRDLSLVEKSRGDGLKYEAVTNIPGLFGTDWMVKAPEEIVKRGGAMSTSSCTTNGNIMGDTIMILALHCYFDFFADTVKEYYTCTDAGKRAKIEEKIEKKFSEFKGYLNKILSRRAHMIKTIFNFYYDQVSYINTDMQHGLTRSESPEVLDFLRETSSGSQTEVPKLLSLPGREKDYLKGLKAIVTEQISAEKDDQEKKGLTEQLKKIEDSIKTIEKNINIVDILEKAEGK
ncbi:MAG TPA: hypothetical protein PLT09_03130 [Deltaproteobacteria bacterium]|nr:hypothetical protein [Deltaproteobacteria bacterium]HPR53971.1 hypothetical protein [Deltaproteobacteria bacterium]HXK46406.1 hypothetical protein [Deltaproteobacteria bacterium]